MKKLYYSTLLILSLSISSLAQSIESFTLDDVNSSKEVSLSDFSKEKAVVIIFTSNVCPYSIYYEGRITQLISDYKDKEVQFLLINSHESAKESVEEMANKIKTWGIDVPYLADKDQIAKNTLNATKSPEAFVLGPKGGSFTVFYSGAIDNNPQVATDVKDSYLRSNIRNILQGKPAVKGTQAIGCMIR